MLVSAGGAGCGPQATEEAAGAAANHYTPSGAAGLGAASRVYTTFDIGGKLHTSTDDPPMVTPESTKPLKDGMSYAEAIRLIGHEPSSVVQDESPFSDVRITTAQWINGDLSQVTIRFVEDKLVEIAQTPAP